MVTIYFLAGDAEEPPPVPPRTNTRTEQSLNSTQTSKDRQSAHHGKFKKIVFHGRRSLWYKAYDCGKSKLMFNWHPNSLYKFDTKLCVWILFKNSGIALLCSSKFNVIQQIKYCSLSSPVFKTDISESKVMWRPKEMFLSPGKFIFSGRLNVVYHWNLIENCTFPPLNQAKQNAKITRSIFKSLHNDSILFEVWWLKSRRTCWDKTGIWS